MFGDGSVTMFRVRGIPVRAHWTLFLAIPYLALVFSRQFALLARMADVEPGTVTMPPLVWGALVAIGLFASIALHELAHSLVAIRAGGRVRDITLMLLGGVSRIERLPRKPSLEALIAGAGPAMSLALGGLLYLVHGAMTHVASDPRMGIFYLAQTNVVLGVFNLLPAFPMDGGRVLRAVLAGRLGSARATAIAANVGKVGAVLLGLIGFWSGNWLLLLIAFFVYSGAGIEAGEEEAREALEGVRVADVMIREPPTVPLETTLAEIPTVMRSVGRLELVVVDERDQAAGVLCATDLADVDPRALETLRVRDLKERAAAHAVAVSATELVVEALDHAEKEGAEYVMVVDHGPERPGVIGLLGRAEIQRALVLSSLTRRRREFTAFPRHREA